MANVLTPDPVGNLTLLALHCLYPSCVYCILSPRCVNSEACTTGASPYVYPNALFKASISIVRYSDQNPLSAKYHYINAKYIQTLNKLFS